MSSCPPLTMFTLTDQMEVIHKSDLARRPPVAHPCSKISKTSQSEGDAF